MGIHITCLADSSQATDVFLGITDGINVIVADCSIPITSLTRGAVNVFDD